MNKTKIILVGLLLILLVSIRFFEKSFFDDGLIDFFRHDYLSEDLPEVSVSHILLTDTLRFLLNSLFSVGVLYILFRRKDLLRFLLLIYGLVFILGILFFYYELTHYHRGNYLTLFYVRRLLIQPLLLLILIPALLYQNKSVA